MRQCEKIHSSLQVQPISPMQRTEDRICMIENEIDSEAQCTAQAFITKRQYSSLRSSQKSETPPCEANNIPLETLGVRRQVQIINTTFQSKTQKNLNQNCQEYPEFNYNYQDQGRGGCEDLLSQPHLKTRNIFSIISIAGYVKKFVRHMKSFKFYSWFIIRLNQDIQLHPSQLGLINDYGADDPQNLGSMNHVSLAKLYLNKKFRQLTWTQKLMSKCLRFLRYIDHSKLFIQMTRLITYIPVLSPDHIVKQIWDGIIALTKIYLIIMIPVELCFNNGVIYGQNYNFVTTTLCSLMVIDEFFSLNNESFEFGHLIIYRNQQGYVRILEMFSIFILMVKINKNNKINSLVSYSQPLAIQNSFMNQLSIIFYIQFVFLSHYQRKFEAQLNLSKYQNSIYRVFKLIITMIFVEHVASCIWYTVGIYGMQQGYQKNWIQVYQLQDSNWQEQYFESLYFNVVTMISVGYGDITPQNDYEKLFTIVFMIFSSIQLSYVLSTCGAIILELTELTERTNRKIRIINSYMKRKNINKKIQEQTREYLYHFLYQQNEQEIKEESEIISQLSQKLQETLIIDSNSQILQSVDVFKKQFSPLMIAALSKIMKSDIAYPEEQISLSLFKNHQGPLIFFIESGMIEEYVEGDGQQTKNTLLQQYKKGEHFGLLEFFSQLNPEKKKYKSRGFTKVIILKKKDFIDVIQDFPNDMERYFMIQNQILFSNNLDILNTSCGSCYQIDHSNISCPLIHHRIDREKIIKTYCYNSTQERSYILRNRLKNDYNSIVDQQMLDETGQTWRQDNLAYIDKFQKEDGDDNEDEQENIRDTKFSPKLINGNKMEEIDFVPINEIKQIQPFVNGEVVTQMSDQQESQQLISNQELNSQDIVNRTTYSKKTQVYGKFDGKQSNFKSTLKLNAIDSLQRLLSSHQQMSLDNSNYWYQRIEQKLKNQGRLNNNKPLKDIEITYFKLKLQIDYKDPYDEQFEHLREYHIFNPQSNFSTISDRMILINLSQYEVEPKEKIKRFQTDVWHLSKYFLYPYQFMKKYQPKILNKFDSNDESKISPTKSLIKHRLSRTLVSKRLSR